MAFTIQQRDISLLRLHNRRVTIKLEVLNTRMQVVSTLEGDCIDAPLSLQPSSDIRRTCCLTLAIRDKHKPLASDERLWMNKRIRVSYGIYDPINGADRFYPVGVFVLAENTYTFNSSSSSLSVSLLDLMSTMTAEYGSAMGGAQITIEAGTDMRNAMISTVSQLGLCTQYQICEFTEERGLVPYDLEFATGTYPYELIKKLRDLYPYYETFFDVDGTFICRRIPTCLDDDVLLSAEIMDELLIEMQPRWNFCEVFNTTEVWGQELSSDRWSETCVSSGNIYTLNIPDITIMDDGILYGFVPDRDSIAGQRIQINSLPAYPIYVSETRPTGELVDIPLEPGQMQAGSSYVLHYSDKKFMLQGELTIHVLVMEVNALPSEAEQQQHKRDHGCENVRYVINPESPFAADREGVGIKKRVLSGGEFEAIYTTELAFDRAAYENWLTTRLVEKSNIQCLLIPWLDANQLIELTSPLSGSVERYITGACTFNFAKSTMEVEVTRFYPYYPWL